jgi:hypothetical protein
MRSRYGLVAIVALIIVGELVLRVRDARVPAYVDVRGRVYAAFQSDPQTPPTPLTGAIVSSDTATATTDDAGGFRVRVKRVAADEFTTLRVEAGDRTACARLTGSVRGPVTIFLDGGPFGSQRCASRGAGVSGRF